MKDLVSEIVRKEIKKVIKENSEETIYTLSFFNLTSKKHFEDSEYCNKEYYILDEAIKDARKAALKYVYEDNDIQISVIKCSADNEKKDVFCTSNKDIDKRGQKTNTDVSDWPISFPKNESKIRKIVKESVEKYLK